MYLHNELQARFYLFRVFLSSFTVKASLVKDQKNTFITSLSPLPKSSIKYSLK